MKNFTLAAGILLLSAGSAAYAQDAGEAAVNASQNAQTAAEEEELTAAEAHAQEVVCRTERVTGSRTRVNRTCMTRTEWRAFHARTRDDVDELQGRSSGGFVPGDPAAPPG